MNHSRATLRAAGTEFTKATNKGWPASLGYRLSRYVPPYHDWRFWVVQVLVGAIAAAHYTIEFKGYLSHFETLYFVPVILFVIPIVYSALAFGFAGSMATALWVLIIAIPNSVIWHSGLERVGEASQMMLMIVLAAFVGRQVDRERTARGQAEIAAAAHKSSEAKYRGLFESSPVAVVVLDKNGVVMEANPAAGVLFRRKTEVMKGMPVAHLVGIENASKLLAPGDKDDRQGRFLTIDPGGGSDVIYLEPTQTRLDDTSDNAIVEVLLRDVTRERYREAGLKAYTAYVLRAQEEERQRIARDLHDDTLQAMALLVMKLDNVSHTSGALPASTVQQLAEARAAAKEIVQGLRDFTKSLRPPILDDLGLVASIRRLVADFGERTETAAQFLLEGEERRLSENTEIGLFRIAQEALRNVEKHSKATRAVVTITLTEPEARLTVTDNGVGFAVPSQLPALSVSGRLGLLGMQERAESLGGRFEVLSNPETGTTVAVSVPIS